MGTVVGVVLQTLAVVAAVEDGTSKRGVGCVRYFAMRALAGGSGVGVTSGRGGCFTYVRLGPVGVYPASDRQAFFPGKPGHGEVEVRDVVV